MKTTFPVKIRTYERKENNFRVHFIADLQVRTIKRSERYRLTAANLKMWQKCNHLCQHVRLKSCRVWLGHLTIECTKPPPPSPKKAWLIQIRSAQCQTEWFNHYLHGYSVLFSNKTLNYFSFLEVPSSSSSWLTKFEWQPSSTKVNKVIWLLYFWPWKYHQARLF